MDVRLRGEVNEQGHERAGRGSVGSAAEVGEGFAGGAGQTAVAVAVAVAAAGPSGALRAHSVLR